jgi:hypothetical protein
MAVQSAEPLQQYVRRARIGDQKISVNIERLFGGLSLLQGSPPLSYATPPLLT